jgi:subtilisin family serine protease
VAAIDRNGALGTFSNYGLRTVHIGAPGVDVLSTVPGGYSYMSGTSMATPHVTGGVGLYASTHPGKSANDIRQALLQSATTTAALTGKTTTGKRLNLAQVIALSGGGTPTPAKFEGAKVVNGQFLVALKGTVGQQYEVQVSPDLANWTTLGTVTNTTGTAEMADAISANWPRKFYRAITK